MSWVGRMGFVGWVPPVTWLVGELVSGLFLVSYTVGGFLL